MDPLVCSNLPATWNYRLHLEQEDVWMEFLLFALLNDIQERRENGYEEMLQVRHDTSSQAERLRPVLQARNKCMIGPGRENWNHACNLCCWISKDDNG